MRRLLFLYILIGSFTGVYAQTSGLLINENFTGYSIGNLNGQEGWRVSGNSDYVQVDRSLPVDYTLYRGGGQYVNLVHRGDYLGSSMKYPDDPYEPFRDGVVSVVSGNTTFYASFLVRVPAMAGTQTTGDARPTMALRAVNGSTLAHFYIANDNNSYTVKFGIGKDAGQPGNFAPGSYEFNTTYLIVLRYDVANGNATSDYDDKMYMWVNPVITSEPELGSADAAIENFSDFQYDGGFTGVIHALQLFQSEGSATAAFDAFRVAYAQDYPSPEENATAAWQALQPAAADIPVKEVAITGINNIKAYPVNAGIQVDWDVISESNVAEYIIERSADGVSFGSSHTRAPANKEGPAAYTWVDEKPVAATSYYRIKKIYEEGNTMYSQIVKVRTGLLNKTGFTIYPNPVDVGVISIQATELRKGMYQLAIFSAIGQQLYVKQINHPGGVMIQSLDLPPALQDGVYHIQLTGCGFKLATQFLVQ